MTVKELRLREKYNLNLVLIKRAWQGEKEEEEIINVPMPDTIIYQGDILMVAGADTDLANLPQG
jgi:Trk K+ transport system NAD-binding subunit